MRPDNTMGREGIDRSRRAILAGSVAALGGLAGCTGDNEDSSSGDNTPDGEEPSTSSGSNTTATSSGSNTTATQPAPATCAELTEGYQTVDPGEHPLTVRFERPAVLTNVRYTSPPNFAVKLRPADAGSAAYPTLFRFQQTALTRYQHEESYSESAGRRENASVVSFEFDGETLEADLSVTNTSVNVGTRLPFAFERGKRYINTKVRIQVFNESSGGSIDEACGENMRTAAVHALETLEANPQTTVQSATEQYN